MSKFLFRKLLLLSTVSLLSISIIGCSNTKSDIYSSSIKEESNTDTQNIHTPDEDRPDELNTLYETNELTTDTEEFWVEFIKENSNAYNHNTTDEIREAPLEWICNNPPLTVLDGDENWSLTDNHDALNSVIEPNRTNSDLRYNYGNYYSINVNIKNLSETAMTGKECIENGYYYINKFYSNYSEYSQLNRNEEDANNFLLYLDNHLGDPNEIYVCDTDTGYDHIECCNYITFEDNSQATMYYYYVYKYTDRTLVVQVREVYTLDENLNITDLECLEADSIGLEQYYCPSNFNLFDTRILSICRSFN